MFVGFRLSGLGLNAHSEGTRDFNAKVLGFGIRLASM